MKLPEEKVYNIVLNDKYDINLGADHENGIPLKISEDIQNVNVLKIRTERAIIAEDDRQ